jgi:hypothetical protein
MKVVNKYAKKEVLALLGCYSLSVPVSRPIGCPEMSATNYNQRWVISKKTGDLIYTAAEA